MKNQNHDDEKLNKKNLIIDDADLSLDEEIKTSKGNFAARSWNRTKDVWANVYKWFVHHPLFTYSIKRIFYGLVTLLIAIIVIFLLTRAIIDDNQFLPDDVSAMGLKPDEVQALLKARMDAFGVSGNLGTQLGNYLKDLFPLIPKKIYSEWTINGDGTITKQMKTVWLYLGSVTNSSIATPGSGVLEIFNDAVPYTFVYALITVLISFIIAIPLGIQAARMRSKTSGWIINGLAIVLTAIPAAVIVAGFYLIATGTNGTSGLFASGSFWSKFWPAISLILVIMPPQVIMIRRYVMDEMSGEYVKFALSQGLSQRFVFYVYVFRNAAARVLKAVPLEIVIAMFGSTILIEQQWSIPGMGSIIVKAIGAKDPFVIMGFVSFAAFIEIFGSLLSDLIIVWLDPKASLNQRK